MESVTLSLVQPLQQEQDVVINQDPPGPTCLQLAGRALIRTVSHPATTCLASFILVNSLCFNGSMPEVIGAGGVDLLSLSSSFLGVNPGPAMMLRFVRNTLAGGCGGIAGFLAWWLFVDVQPGSVNSVWALN